jgi:pyruvate/2-oxoglutarate dehydrogenase complex dihydrolipoamide acyltransferase (E2) component
MAIRHRVQLPSLGDTVSAVVLVEWHVGPGDVVEPGQAVATVETDKVDTEIPSPVGGTVVELVAAAGSELAADALICIIET